MSDDEARWLYRSSYTDEEWAALSDRTKSIIELFEAQLAWAYKEGPSHE